MPEFNIAEVQEAVAAAKPEAECFVYRERRYSWTDVTDRTRRLANCLRAQGLGAHRERSELAGWERGQDMLALYLHNGPEYLEGMYGAYKARVAPFNVNYRYVAEELRHLFADAGARAVVYHGAFAPRLAEVLPDLPDLRVLLQVDDGSGAPLLPGAVEYEQALAAASPTRPPLDWSPDDLYVLYTGGTTGLPKGVLWRIADIFVSGFVGRNATTNGEFDSLDEIVEAAVADGVRAMVTPPLMHGAAQWFVFNQLDAGGTAIFPSRPERLDAADVWSVVAAEKCNAMLIVGDAFATPLLYELDAHDYDLSSLFLIVSGGAPLSPANKERLLAHLPNAMVLDAIGASETGGQGRNFSAAGAAATSGGFEPSSDTAVLSEDLRRVVEPGEDELGWLAQRGRIPLGYLGDRAKTERTFPVVGDARWAVPGDRARWRDAETIEVLGRDTVTINTGGEKVFAEEVEQALKQHAAVDDAVVVGRPNERWGQEIVALVRLAPGATGDEAALVAECERHVARYKLPRRIIFLDELVRSPAGKADYRWARDVATRDAADG
ncbi:MAG: acyl-CoA synthetase [Acidimicrobiia bacterium]